MRSSKKTNEMKQALATSKDVPDALESSCFVCPENTSPDDYIDFGILWCNLCEIASTRRLSSTITAHALAERLSLRHIFTRGQSSLDCQENQKQKVDALIEGGPGSSSDRSTGRKRSAEQLGASVSGHVCVCAHVYDTLVRKIRSDKINFKCPILIQTRAGDGANAENVTTIRHWALELSGHPERGREFVCTAHDGLAAGAYVCGCV